jgi:hypothetical protein
LYLYRMKQQKEAKQKAEIKVSKEDKKILKILESWKDPTRKDEVDVIYDIEQLLSLMKLSEKPIDVAASITRTVPPGTIAIWMKNKEAFIQAMAEQATRNDLMGLFTARKSTKGTTTQGIQQQKGHETEALPRGRHLALEDTDQPPKHPENKRSAHHLSEDCMDMDELHHTGTTTQGTKQTQTPNSITKVNA